MKKVILTALFLLFASPTLAQIPEGMPGVTATQFSQIKNGTCFSGYLFDGYSPEVNAPIVCDDIVERFIGVPFFNVDTGSMYRITQEPTSVVLNSYLPDGVYKPIETTSRAVHYVKDGQELYLTKGHAYRDLKRAGKLGFLQQLTGDQVTGLRVQCETASASCEQVLQALDLRAGMIFYSSETKRLYMLKHTESGTKFIQLNRYMNGVRIRKFLRRNATETQGSILWDMPFYTISGFSVGGDYYWEF